MNNDKTIINKLWWLNKFLNDHFEGKDYADIHDKTLNADITKEVDELVEHIKLNY